MSMHELETELNRILTRLSHLNDQQRTLAATHVHATAQRIRDLTIKCGDHGPKELPTVDPRIVGAQLQVVCTDLQMLASGDVLNQAVRGLASLRRALP